MFRKIENGRTLLEMIGVITMIGVLTVGGTSLYTKAMAKVRLNNLLEEVRKRALVADRKTSSIYTYGMFNAKAGGAKSVTSYGYGIGDNESGRKHSDGTDLSGVWRSAGTVKVLVGQLGTGGNPLDPAVCEALLASVVEKDEIKTGSVVGVYKENCKDTLTACRSKDEDGKMVNEVPLVVCIEIKS